MSVVRRGRCAVCVLAVVVASFSAASTSLAAGSISCPKFTDAEIRGAVGGKPMLLPPGLPSGGTIASGGGSAITCQWLLGTEPSITLKLYRSPDALAALAKEIGVVEGMNNGEANDAGGHCTPATAGDCQGTKFDEHLSPLSGLGQKAYDDPGGPSDGANVEFVWKGTTYALRSSGPYGEPGPNLRAVIAFARLIIRSGYTP